MADQLKQIKEFPQKADFGDDDLLLIQGDGTTYNVSGRAVKRYAENAAAPQVELARKEAQAAADAADRAEDAIQHPAIPDLNTGNWLVWDQVSESYQQTEPPVRAEGQDFEIRGYYPTLEALEAAVPEPEKGYAYGVGTEAPYDIYVWDLVHGVWVNNGPMTASGDMLKSVYDPEHREQDIFAYAEAAHVGKSMAGQTVEPTQGTTVKAGIGAEIFNDYLARTFAADGRVSQGNVASGDKSHAEGSCTTAKGHHSHAEGINTISNMYASHAEGDKTQTDGSASHAEGYRTRAIGSASHAEGDNTQATGRDSHAEGYTTSAVSHYSHAEGHNTIAGNANEPSKTECAHAEGYKTKAGTEEQSSYVKAPHAEGYTTSADGTGAHAEGYRTVANGEATHAEGGNTEATEKWSHAEGSNSKATNESSHAEGRLTVASGPWSHAEGYGTTAAEYDAHAEGINTRALSANSHAAGQGTVAEYHSETVVGRWNVEKNPGDYNSLSDLFVVGKGSNPDSRANALRVNHSGVYGTGAFNSSGADYAELFEWADGNPGNIDRTGRFVTLEGERIRLAGPGDGYILGIVSGAPSVVGDVYDDQWQGMYLTDVFGRPIFEDVEVPAETEEVLVTAPPVGENGEIMENALETRTETRVVVPAHTERRQKLNPAFDNRQLPYIPRSERPEWDAVGLLGKLVAVDDGTCLPNGWATVGEGGAATNSEERTRYRVMARLDERHVRILIL